MTAPNEEPLSSTEIPELLSDEHEGILDWHNLTPDFLKTPAGLFLVGQSRFSDYQLTNLNPAAFSTLLGPNVNNLTHGDFTAQLAERFVADNTEAGGVDFLEAEKNMLVFTAAAHDYGETYVQGLEFIGDQPYWEKRSANDKSDIEAGVRTAALRSVIEVEESLTLENAMTVAGTGNPEVAQELFEDVIWSINAIDGSSSFTEISDRLSYPFSVIEHIGYMDAALRAGEVSMEDLMSLNDIGRLLVSQVVASNGEVEEQYERICDMNRMVVGNWALKLIEHSEDFPAAGMYILRNKHRILGALERGVQRAAFDVSYTPQSTDDSFVNILDKFETDLKKLEARFAT